MIDTSAVNYIKVEVKPNLLPGDKRILIIERSFWLGWNMTGQHSSQQTSTTVCCPLTLLRHKKFPNFEAMVGHDEVYSLKYCAWVHFHVSASICTFYCTSLHFYWVESKTSNCINFIINQTINITLFDFIVFNESQSVGKILHPSHDNCKMCL